MPDDYYLLCALAEFSSKGAVETLNRTADLVKIVRIKQACFQIGRKGLSSSAIAYNLDLSLCFGASDADAGSTLPDSCRGIAASAALRFDEKAQRFYVLDVFWDNSVAPFVFRLRICVADFENAIVGARDET